MKKKILVLCTGNSCRSQIAEGYLRHFAGGRADVYSAGVETHGVNPHAVATMKEDGIDISGHTSNNVDEYRDIDFDYVITVCDNARELCPYFPTKAAKFHQNFPDPAKAQGTETEVMAEFRRMRDLIKAYCKQFVNQFIHVDLSERAVGKFREGYNCAQSVLYAFIGNRMDEDLAMNISIGFGAGMARKQEVCGAVSGGIMVLGLTYGDDGDNIKEKTNHVYGKVQRLIGRFIEEKNTINCAELLNGCNLLTDEGQASFQKNHLKENVCCGCVALTCRILEEIIDENINK
jgi:arsenate reductase